MSLIGIGAGIPFVRGGGLVRAIQALFAASEKGVWYDPSDLSTLFQDSAGTTPVTAVGQVVGLMLDKSGNGFNATQTTTAAKPILQQDAGGHYYLKFDGLDDFLSVPLLALGTSYSIFAGIVPSDVSVGDRTVFSQRSNVSANPVKAALDITAASLRSYVRNDAGTVGDGLTYTVTAETPYAVTNTYTAGAQVLRVNAVQRDTGIVTIDAATVTNNSIGRAELGTPSAYFNGRVYSLIVRGALSDAAQITSVETYVNSKTGAY